MNYFAFKMCCVEYDSSEHWGADMDDIPKNHI